MLSSPSGLVTNGGRTGRFFGSSSSLSSLGSLVAFFPIFMGNGQVLAQALLSSQPIPYLPLTLAVKGLLVYLLLRNGAYGGTLTPSFALGIDLAI